MTFVLQLLSYAAAAWSLPIGGEKIERHTPSRGTGEVCYMVKQQCRACPHPGSLEGCSLPGIACQPVRRVCRPRNASPMKVERPHRTPA
jgi:hypothetical protein